MSEYNITLPYTGETSKVLSFLPKERACLNIYDNRTIIFGNRNCTLAAVGSSISEAQYYSAILGGTQNCFRQDTTNYPYNPISIRDGVGSGSGVASVILGGSSNRSFGDYNVVLGGTRNCAYQQATMVLGGFDNEVGGRYNAVINGFLNCIASGTSNSVIIAGSDNIIGRCSIGNGIVAGQFNRISPNSSQSLILGGAFQTLGAPPRGSYTNWAGTNFLQGGNACYSYILGGYWNAISSGNCFSSILGGSCNVIDATKAKKEDVFATGWSHIIVSNSSCIGSNLSFILGGDNARISESSNKSFVIGANTWIHSPYSYVIGGTASTIKPGDTNSAIISQQINNKNISSRGPNSLLLNFDSGVYISSDLNIEGHIRLLSETAPTDPNSSGIKGQIALDDNYLYYCRQDNRWVRTAFSEWEGKVAAPKSFDYYRTTYSGNQVMYTEDIQIANKFPIDFITAYENNPLGLSTNVLVRPLFDKHRNSSSLNLNSLEFSVSPSLKNGLTFNTGNGVITGVLTGIGITETVRHWITASNTAGKTSGFLDITYEPTIDTNTAVVLQSQNQWLQGCGCGCAGGIGAGATLVSYFVRYTQTINTNGDIRILVGGVTSQVDRKEIAYSLDGVNYLNVQTSSTWPQDLAYNYTIPYLDQNIFIRLKIYYSNIGPSVPYAQIIYRYNPVQATSD